MLKKLRQKKTAKKVWIILCILILPAFLFWGLGGALRSGKEPSYAGKISGKKVSLLEYKDALEAVKNQAIIQFGDKFSEIQPYLNLESQAWERLTLLWEAKNRKINISNQEVIEQIENYPFFQRKGKFDNSIYAQMLRYVFRTQPRAFEEETRQNLALAKLYQETTGALKVSEEEIKEEYRKANEEASIYYIAGLSVDFLKGTQASEQEVKDYFAKNQSQFKQPASFNVEYFSLENEDKLKNIIPRLNKKENFNKVAGGLGASVKETGFFAQTDPLPGIGWLPQILNLLSKAKAGQVMPPVYADKKYYVLRLKEKKEAYIPELEKIKDKAKEALLKDKAKEAAKAKTEACLKKLKEIYRINPKGTDFSKLAKLYSLKAGSTSLFKYGSYIEGIGASDNFWLAALKLKRDEFSGVLNVPEGFYIIKLKSKTSLDEEKFASEKMEFSQKLLQQEKQDYFLKFVEELKRKAGVS